jgi:hypothetical protein
LPHCWFASALGMDQLPCMFCVWRNAKLAASDAVEQPAEMRATCGGTWSLRCHPAWITVAAPGCGV